MPEPPRGQRRRARRRRAALAVAAAGLSTVLTATLTACSDTGDASRGITLTFTWWGNDDRAARTNEAVKLFEKENPGITVRTSSSTFESYMQKLATQAAGGEVPDVAQLDYRQISQYSGGGALLPLDKDLRNGTIRTSDVDKELLRTGAYQGQQYALPMGRGITGFAYDAAAYDKAGVGRPKLGWEWKDWARASEKVAALGLRSPDGRAFTGSNDLGTNEDIFEVWLRGRGGRLYESEKKLGFTEDDLTEFWTFTNKLREKGAVAEARDTAQADSVETGPMGRRLAAADFTWDAPFPSYLALLDTTVRFAPVPTTDGRMGAYFKPSMLMGIGSGTEHPRAAAKLVDFLLNDRRAGKALGFSRSTPPNRKIAADVAKTLKGPEREIFEYARNVEDYGVDPPPKAPPKGDVPIQTAFARHYQRVMYEVTTPREAAREFIDEADRELRS